MHLLRAATFNGFTDIAQEMRLDIPALLHAAGLPLDVLDPKNSDMYYPLAGFEKLYGLAEQQTGRCDLAAMHGRRQELSALLGVLGFYMQQGRTIGEALHVLEHYISFQVQGGELLIYEYGSSAVLELVIKDATRLKSTRYSTEFSLAAANAIFASLCGPSWKPEAIHFMHAPPSNAKYLQRHYSAPISFNQEHNALYFDPQDLATPIATSNPQLKQVLERSLADLEEKYTDDLVAQVEHLIYSALTTGNCTADSIASFLGIHRRTMHRLLKKEGSSYTRLLDQVREDMARRMLKHSNMQLTQISLLLGYSELSAFSRAFRRWTSLAPQDYRKN